MSLSFLAGLVLLLSRPVFATEFFEVHTNARALGLGGAYSALVDDAESLWYNPAGIARNGGLYWTIADPKVGASDIANAYTAFTELQDPATFANALNGLYGEPVWLGGSAKSSFIMPYFAVAYFYDVDGSFLAENPVSPTFTTNYITDTGVALGTGFSIGSILQMGFATKYVTRTGDRVDWGAQTIADIIAGTSSPDLIFDTLSATKGTGYAFDMGLNLTIPLPVQPTISFVWKNIGNTKYRAGIGEDTPPTDYSDMSVGASMLFDAWIVHFVPVLEVKHIEDGGQIGQKLHMGVELGLPFIDLRAGLHQGYYTAGLGLDLGILKIDAATWGVELGGYPGQYESRRYMVQATLSLGFDFGWGSGAGSGNSGSGGSSVGKAGSGAGGSSSSGGSRGGRGRVKGGKQRR
jgi:hypothetical protein